MANFEKIVRVTDAALDCIPIVSSITNAAHAIYKLAHKVDALSPVAPGLKTSIKIHSLSKENLVCLIVSVPILGNLTALSVFVWRAIHRFDYLPGMFWPVHDDDLSTAVIRNNQEIVHLCLGNNPLNDPDRADRIFGQSAHSSNSETFRQILHHRDDWSAQNLMHGLRSCWVANEQNVANANDILDFWTAHGKVLEPHDTYSALHICENFLKSGQVDLAGRVLGILPDAIPFWTMQEILLKYSCAQYNHRGEVQETGILTTEQRQVLIAKSTKPSLAQLQEYARSAEFQLRTNRTADNARETHFDTLNQLLDLAQLQPDAMGALIASAAGSNECAFIEPLVAKYEGQLTPQSKVQILEKLLPHNFDKSASCEKKTQLFASWIGRWKDDVSAHARPLYAVISRNARFKQILLEAFPGCDQSPQEQAV